METKASQEIDRKNASRILGVSMRTIDRYIRSGKLFAWTDNRRIWLDKEQIMNFPRLQRLTQPLAVSTRQIAKSTQNVVKKDAPFGRSSYGTASSLSLTTPRLGLPEETNFYKDLYEEVKRGTNDYQQKLEQANYRIGQLESQIIHPAVSQTPRHIEHVEHRNDPVAMELLRREITDKEKTVEALKNLLKQEKTGRVVITILMYIVLFALPLVWYLVR